MHACLQEAAVAAQDLKPVVLGHLQEAVGRKHDGVVRQVGIADAEVLLDALHGGCQIHGHPVTASDARSVSCISHGYTGY